MDVLKAPNMRLTHVTQSACHSLEHRMFPFLFEWATFLEKKPKWRYKFTEYLLICLSLHHCLFLFVESVSVKAELWGVDKTQIMK